jgi:energy-converting hydrogenase Eha subunit C
LQKTKDMSAFPILKEIHSFLAYFFLISTVVFVLYCIWRAYTKSSFSSTQVSLARLSFIMSHIQLLIGIVLWWLHGYAQLLSDDAKAVMHDGVMRKLVIEHPLTNIIAITLLSIGFISLKKATTDHSKHIKGIIFYGIALILILAMIPYNQWLH